MRWIVVGIAMLAMACPRAQGTAPREHRAPTPLELVERSVDLDGVTIGASESVTLVVTFASWCIHCKDELAVLASLREKHPRVRILGLNYTAHEEYANRGSSDAVRAYVRDSAAWLRVVPIGDDVFRAFGRPPKVPTMFVFDRTGTLVETYDRRAREMPDAAELDALFARLGRQDR